MSKAVVLALSAVGSFAVAAPVAAKTGPLIVIAEIVAKPESADALRPQMTGLASGARKERGCISYQVYEDRARAGRFLTYESWKDDAALDAHLNSPTMKAAGAKFGAMLAQAPVITRLKTP